MVRRFLMASAVLGLAVVGPQAWAGHGSWGGSSGGSSGGWYSSGGSWGSSGGSWGSSGGSSGSHGGFFARLHARHHHHYPRYRVYYYSSGGSSGGWYSSGGSWGSSGGSSGGASIGSAYKYQPVPLQQAPKAAPAQPKKEAPAEKPADGAKSTSTATGSALLTVSVPEDAKVYVNNRLTKTPGTRRTYVSRGLVGGFDYTYEIRAEVNRDGRVVSRSRVVSLRAGQRANVAIDFDQPADQTETTLTVYVPADAEVYLEGAKTRSKGKVRQFRTSRLKPGEKWEDYTVRVVWNRNGKTLTQERDITLEGGQSQELTIDFDHDVVAQAR